MEENHFKQLRFKDKYCLHRIMTIDEMSELTGLKKSTISKIENNGVDSVNVATLRAYYDNLENVSYEYLMGDVETKDKKYHALGELFPFDDCFYNNLTQLLEMDKENHMIETMLFALLSNPQELFNFLVVTFNALYKIDNIQKDSTLSASTKTETIKMQEYIYNQTTINFLENHIMPLLTHAFAYKNAQLEQEAQETEVFMDTYSDDNAVTATVHSIEPITIK